MHIHNIHVKSNKPQRLYNTGSSYSGPCRSTILIIIATLIVIIYIILKKPDDSLEDPSDQYVIRSIPKLYTKLEGIDAEERDVFQGFRTSFLPPEEIVLARRDTGSKKEFYEGNVTSDIFIWGSTDKQNLSPTRLKRTSRFTFSSQDYPDENPSQPRRKFESDEVDDAQDNQSEVEEEYESSDTSEQYEDAENLERVVRPELHVDRGPLDDVVEQIRGQPELEEGELGSSAYQYKPGKNYAGIHAFWKGQGDKETIRNTQADIMRKYMDAEADPCHDFYQYACGNWASLNPIPADKAGYDTFEMLRENLDTVLKDLLEFKNNENVDSKYPGKHLDLQNLQENFLKSLLPNKTHSKIKSIFHFPKVSYGVDDIPDILGDNEFDVTTPSTVSVPTLDYSNHETYSDPDGLRYSLEFETTKYYVGLDNSPPTNTKAVANKKKKLEKSKETIKHNILNYIHLNASTNKPNKSEIVYRIRRYLNRELKHAPAQNKGRKYRIHHCFSNNEYDHGKRFYKSKNPDTKKHYKKFNNYFPNTKPKFHKILKSKRVKIGRKLLMYTNVYKRNIITLSRKRHTRNARESTKLKPVIQHQSSESRPVTEPTTENSTTKETPTTGQVNKDPAKGDAALKARFLFKSCMNYEILEKRGHQPLLDLLNLLGGWPILDPQWKDEGFNWIELMAKLRLYNNDILISEWVGPDIKNSDEFVIQFDQTSLGLPTRDYFLQNANKVYLEAYKNYLIKIAVLLGGDPRYVKCSANQLLDFETKLARITSAPEDRRNVSELYQRMPLCKLEELVPEVKWKRYLSIIMNRDVKSNETVVLFALSYVRHLVQLISETQPSVLANYLLWRFVRHRVNNLDDRFQSAKQQFYFILFGREQSPPRWKNCISQVNSNMGMALGSMFVKKYFDETSKNDTLTMTWEIQESFKELLHLTNWIDSKTKKLAAHKVEAMMLRIGYPDFILDKKELDDRYKEVSIHPDMYFENILNILQHLTKMEQSRLGQPVNKTLWNTAPAVVNAYYSRNKNQIMFPAGILQPPFYHRHFPRSLNYGGIGVVIGHEITHGFDDKGRLFDCNGNLHRWWSDSAIDSFHRRAQCLIDQYGRYIVPEVNMKLDGVNTQGENIADNGGVKQAFRAYRQWLQRHGTDGETLPGLNHTHTQLFFLNFAQVWCGAMRPEAMRNKLKTAVHSPGRFRVIGTLSNSHDFAREFQCPPGTPMNPKQKCTVW